MVIDPAPAIRGKAIGKMDPAPMRIMLKQLLPSIISMAMRKIINEPAITKEETSIPKIPSKGLPINKNASKMKKDTR